MKIKQYYPFIVPAISLILVLFLAFRWYNLRTQRDSISDVTQVEVEDLTQEELLVVQGASDVSTVDLKSETDEPAIGQVRYKVEDERVLITITADLPELETESYQVWFAGQGKEPQQAFMLTRSKAGYLGSASLNIENLPLEVLVTDQSGVTAGQMGRQLLKGLIEAQE